MMENFEGTVELFIFAVADKHLANIGFKCRFYWVKTILLPLLLVMDQAPLRSFLSTPPLKSRHQGKQLLLHLLYNLLLFTLAISVLKTFAQPYIATSPIVKDWLQYHCE
jgi:hypothetical protein